MQTIKAHDKAIVVVLTKAEAQAMYKKVSVVSGLKPTKPLLKAKDKLAVQLGEFNER